MLESPRYVPCYVFHFLFSQHTILLKAERTRGAGSNPVWSDRMVSIKQAQSNTTRSSIHSFICSFPE